MIKDMENPLYKAKSSRPALPKPITMRPPPATLSLEGVSIAPLTDEATEQPKGESRPTQSTPSATGIMVIVPYAFLEKLAQDQRQTRALFDQVIERLSRVVQSDV